MQVKELLEIINIEQERLNEQIKQDKWNAANRNNEGVKKFYKQQILINENQCDKLYNVIQTIQLYILVEDMPD